MPSVSRRSFLEILGTSMGAITLLPAETSYASGGGKILLTPELAETYATIFARSVTGNVDLIARVAYVFYSLEMKPLGYFVNLFAPSGESAGYVVLDSSDPSLIAEFSFDRMARAPFDATSAFEANSRRVVVKTGAFAYASVDFDSGLVTDAYGRDVTEEVANSAIVLAVPDSNLDEIFIDELLSDKYDVEELYVTNKGFSTFPESLIIARTGRYACAVTAMMNCAAAYCAGDDWPSINDDKWTSYYMELWRLSKTSTYAGQNGVYNGSTQNGEIGPAFASFCNNRGVTVTYSSGTSPTFRQFKAVIQRNDYGIFCCGINIQGERDGHAMAVEGCAVIKPAGIATTTGMQVLLVSDGWNSNNTNARYLNLAFAKYTDTYGVFFD